MGVTYLGSAATKMHTPMFFSGDQLRFWMMTNVNSLNPVCEFLSQFPGLIVTMSYVTIVWEILFVFIAWKGTARTIMLTMGVFFHLMTYFTLGLLVFKESITLLKVVGALIVVLGIIVLRAD